MQDTAYKAFHEKLIPSVASERVIGVRTPALRKFTAELAKTKDASAFMKNLPHTYYEENNLHAFLIEKIGDFEKTVSALHEFLPYVDNWATCDMMSPKIFKKHKKELLPFIHQWLADDHIYTVRFGVCMLMRHYLDEEFREEYLGLVASVHSQDYYIQMVMAWYFAEALTKQYDAAITYIEGRKLPLWIHNKAISKACDSFRIPPETKEYLRSLRMKKT